jgi:hypothetical protein
MGGNASGHEQWTNRLLWYETTLLLATPDHPGQREQAGAYDVKPYPRRQTASMDSQVGPAGGVRPDDKVPPDQDRPARGLELVEEGKRDKEGKRDRSDIVKLSGPADVRAIFTRARHFDFGPPFAGDP